MIKKYWIGIAAIVLLLICILISILIPKNILNTDNIVQALLISSGWALFLVQYFYSKSEIFFIKVNGLRLWLFSESTKWNFTVDFLGCSENEPIEVIWKVVSTHNKKAIRWHNDSKSIIMNMPGYTIRSFISRDRNFEDLQFDSEETICFEVSNLELPYRSYKRTIENEIIPLLEDLAKTLRPSNEKYVAKIGFSTPNPYFGFFVRKLDLPKVVTFTCDVIDSSIGGNKQTVTVRKDRLEIVTDNLNALRSLSMKYITLSVE